MTSTTSKLTALRDAAANSPEYADIVPLFTGLYEYISGREHLTGISVNLDNIDPAVRITNGFPLLSSHELKIDRAQAAVFIAGLIEVLSGAGRDGQQELARIGAALEKGGLDPEVLFTAILERRRSALDEAAATADVPPPLVEYLFEIPLRTALELAATNVSADTFADWAEGNCPFCGSRAGMAELAGEEGRRHLCCATCNTRWPFKRLKCPYCGNEEVEKLSYFTAGEGATRVDTCKGCSRYIKTRDSRKGGEGQPLEVEDLLTIHLDLLASREGFERGK
jgi:FdhE protein